MRRRPSRTERANDGDSTRRRPTRRELLAAAGKTVPDVIARDLKVLFVGINPGLYTAAVGHHFARPGNRFWPALHLSGFTPHLMSPYDEDELLDLGYGVTNVVPRATAGAAELTNEELIAGGKQLRAQIRRYRPKIAAIVGVGAYRVALHRPDATVGRQEETIDDSVLWLLPNPSGLNAHYPLKRLVEEFAKLRKESAHH